MKKLLLLAALLAAALAAPSGGGSLAADIPGEPKLHAGAGGLVGGYQLETGDDGYFELFTAGMSGTGLRALGRFNGRLAGVAADPNGRFLALTRDGALGVYGDDTETLAFPDSRWSMRALTWWDGGPLAVNHDNGRLHLATLGEKGSWRQDETPLAVEERPGTVALAGEGDSLHLLWNSGATDLSAGVIRHLILRDGRWKELPPLPLGDTASFAAVLRDGELRLAALVPDPVAPERTALVFKAHGPDGWRDAQPPDGLVQRLAAATAFAAAARDGRPAWLAVGEQGAYLVPGSPDGYVDAVPVAAPPDQRIGWNLLMRLFTMAAIVFVLAFYCRRSRVLSRMFPARPPDLMSRAGALGVDWILVSFGMVAYHIASGDIVILSELLSMGEVQEMFWVNLAALIVFMAASEGLYGCTPGKFLAGLRVRSALGGPPSLPQVLFRNVMRVVDMFPAIGFPGLVGMFATLFNPRRQRIGDMLAATVVRRHLPLRERKFLLASASPRRLELLRELGLDIRVQPADIDEDAVTADTPEETVRLLAQAKAKAAAMRLEQRDVVVAADTVVVLDGEVLGKPRDARDAAGMLERLSGRSHMVFTGVTVWDAATGQGLSDVEQTEVEFRRLAPEEIENYVASGDPMDKAGAYGVQTGHLVKQVRGSLSNVAGLPMEKLQTMLALLDS